MTPKQIKENQDMRREVMTQETPSIPTTPPGCMGNVAARTG